MYHVYILECLSNPTKSYVGLTTKDPKDRVLEHNSGLSKFTKIDKPWKLIYYENFYCKLCAEKREIFLKSGIGFKIRKLILDYFDVVK